MAIRALFAVALGAVVAACAIKPTAATQDLDCRNSADCRVQVSVDCFMTVFCSAAVDHDRVIGKRNGQIVWELQTQPYTFDRSNGIVFPSDSQGNFRCHVEADGRRFSCTNRGDRGQYKYTVNLSGSPGVRALDPWVVNN